MVVVAKVTALLCPSMIMLSSLFGNGSIKYLTEKELHLDNLTKEIVVNAKNIKEGKLILKDRVIYKIKNKVIIKGKDFKEVFIYGKDGVLKEIDFIINPGTRCSSTLKYKVLEVYYGD